MKNYRQPDQTIWNGRTSESTLYFHEKIKCFDLSEETLPKTDEKVISILGYECDEGVARNKGRVGAVAGPNAIRKMLAPLSNHFKKDTQIFDVGNIICQNNDLERSQRSASDIISYLIENKSFPIVLGGGHDLAYAHYNGIKKCSTNKKIGVINLDAHFDLRTVTDKPNSGTPFYQIAKENGNIHYLCLGIQKASNNRELFETAKALNVQHLENTEYTLENKAHVLQTINDFINEVDYVYLTIDLDGFSSAIAPGVSAPSPFGFGVAIASETIKCICDSKKLISVDLVELNPTYDIDNSTARLAARLIYNIIETL
ncbi:formimidoylglutamase [Aquimarina hainanensis]|uniref:Formimidoylglutamase n=1 Tax=Aquimarina hainanensis TaxID=1578017 RepID=A0ABW5NEI7_9FLAO|nr:formimidoylglutamase [Aquimarina sp. TRL1]QKX06901.1 formimidoylglutamase [Aquimarina sp. TRL1]